MRRTLIADHSISQALQGILAVTSSQWWREPISQNPDGTRQTMLVYGNHLDDAQLVGLMRSLAETADGAVSKASLLYAEAAPRAGSDAVWIRLAGACDLLGTGTKREVEGLELVVYNAFLRRLRCSPGHG